MSSPVSMFNHLFGSPNTSTTLNFGCNIEDAATENHVLERVGSYGSQLNRIIDVIEILLKHAGLDQHAELNKLDEPELRKLKAFHRLAKEADKAAKEVTRQRVDDLLESMRTLYKIDPIQFQFYRDRIKTDLDAQGGLNHRRNGEG